LNPLESDTVIEYTSHLLKFFGVNRTVAEFTTASVSDTGGRKNNEDFHGHLTLQNGGCWVVADGLGGHRGGEVASKLAVEEILESFKDHPEASPSALRRHLEVANQAIISHQEEKSSLSSMRTTVVLLVIESDRVLWAHLGDSRLYHFRNGRIIFQTSDHSVPQAMANAGDILPEEIRFHEDRNRLLRVLGKEDDFRPEIEQQEHSVRQGDVFLLCTDGFWEYVLEAEMEEDLSASNRIEEWLKMMEARILERADEKHDNYTATAVSVM